MPWPPRSTRSAAIFVDYLQLLHSRSAQSKHNREREISEISQGLKSLGKELDVPIVVLSQLNRNADGRTGSDKGRPMLSDLRESGSIEQDADFVGLLMREEYYVTDEQERLEVEGRATLIIAKQRNGPVGDVRLMFLKEFMRFEDREKKDDARGD
jgi:replicative DNA helicase